VSTLEAAFKDLLERSAAADRAGDSQERSVLSPLAGVADHVMRVADHPDSSHYRADKSGELVRSALRVQEEVFWAHAGQPDDNSPAGQVIDDACRALNGVLDAVRVVLWRATVAGRAGRPVELSSTSASELRAAAQVLVRWAGSLPTRRDSEADR
jgi:hypothetical protein